MEYRMYGLVARSLSDMQKAIQFGHAVVEYELMTRGAQVRTRLDYNDWAFRDKTFIILNGGSTNSQSLKRGTLQDNFEFLKSNGIAVVAFHEPDVNDAMTAFVFLVDERVWNKEKYPDFEPLDGYADFDQQSAWHQEWVESIGGRKNEILREFLPRFKLA